MPFFVNKDNEYWIKELHEHLLNGKVIFKGTALPNSMINFADKADSVHLPDYKFRFFKSGSPPLARPLTLDSKHYQLSFVIDKSTDKLIVTVNDPIVPKRTVTEGCDKPVQEEKYKKEGIIKEKREEPKISYAEPVMVKN